MSSHVSASAKQYSIRATSDSAGTCVTRRMMVPYSPHTSHQRLPPPAKEPSRRVYGKRATKPLSITADQFLRTSDIFSIPSDLPEKAAHQAQPLPSRKEPAVYSDDSPLSDAEPPDPVQSSHWPRDEQATLPNRRIARPSKPTAEDTASSAATSRCRAPPPRQPPGRLRPPARTDEHIAHVPAGVASRQGPEQETDAQAVRVERKPARRKRRLPVNELLLVPLPNQDSISPPKAPKGSVGVFRKDPISSTAIALLDVVSSDDSDSDLQLRKRKSPLTAIRKRLKTPLSEHKSFKTLRRKRRNRSEIATATVPPPKLGDGFEASELTVSNCKRLQPRHLRSTKRQQPVWEGLQALSLTSGPLPDVAFDHPSSTLKVEKTTESEEPLQFSNHDEPLAADATSPAAIHGPNTVHSTKRRVSFSDRVFAELSSVSAPRCRYSSSDYGDCEDDEAAETYVDVEDLDPDKVIDEDELMLSDEERAIRAASRDTSPTPSPEPCTPRHQPPPAPRLSPIADSRSINTGVSVDFRKQGLPGTLKRVRSSKSSLVEVRDVIEDDYEPDDEQEILFESEPPAHDAPVARREMTFIPDSTVSRKPSLGMPRSILKNSEPSVSSNPSRPRVTASNTRRNSTIAFNEQSHYYTSAISQLDSSPPPQRIIRLKSNQPHVQIPYSRYTVPETSPEPTDYTNATQFHVLRCNQEAASMSHRMPAPPRDLRSLTRTVSREHGTLSQDVRRRRSMPFHNPTKLR